jgi:hypothetical protein
MKNTNPIQLNLDSSNASGNSGNDKQIKTFNKIDDYLYLGRYLYLYLLFSIVLY